MQPLDQATIEACLAEIDRYIKRGSLDTKWENDERNGLILAYNMLHAMIRKQYAPDAAA